MLWAYVITGAVGIAGTALGSWLTGRTQTNNLRLNIDAENKRAQIAEKRRIYAAYLAAGDQLVKAQIRLSRAGADPGPALKFDYEEAVAALISVQAELLLIAPEEVWRLIVKISDARRGYIPGDSTGDGSYPDIYGRLRKAMRSDLGVPD